MSRTEEHVPLLPADQEDGPQDLVLKLAALSSAFKKPYRTGSIKIPTWDAIRDVTHDAAVYIHNKTSADDTDFKDFISDDTNYKNFISGQEDALKKQTADYESESNQQLLTALKKIVENQQKTEKKAWGVLTFTMVMCFLGMGLGIVILCYWGFQKNKEIPTNITALAGTLIGLSSLIQIIVTSASATTFKDRHKDMMEIYRQIQSEDP